jgi:hypothetical protein
LHAERPTATQALGLGIVRAEPQTDGEDGGSEQAQNFHVSVSSVK